MAQSTSTPIPETTFVNAVRLTARQWLAVSGILLLITLTVPWLWTKLERFDMGPDYRLPYRLSDDYWLHQRQLGRLAPGRIVVLGDSVIWGEYVLPDGTLSHCLSQETGRSDRFVNAGVNGLFPLALEGLVDYFGAALRGRQVIVHCNLLWMSSPKADLNTEKEQPFNHVRLVPQFFPRIPCYKADLNDRLGIVLERNNTFLNWIQHLQQAYFGQQSILRWTLADDGRDPPSCPNVYKNPLSQISCVVPGPEKPDSQRGPDSPRHRPWSTNGVGTAHFDWVAPGDSLQWAAFQRLLYRLRKRGNDVLVVVGPFNEHMLAAENRPAYRRLREALVKWITEQNIPCLSPEALPSALYADASHPLTAGYRELAHAIYEDKTFQAWMNQ